MAYCTNCGNILNETAMFCTSCGKPASPISTEAEKPSHTQPAAGEETPSPSTPPQAQEQPCQQPIEQQPATPRRPATPPANGGVASIAHTEEPISTGGYFGIMFLLMLPVINLLCLIVWACGGCRKRNKTNLSRAILLWAVIGSLLGALIMLVMTFVFGFQLDSLYELGNMLEKSQPMPNGI